MSFKANEQEGGGNFPDIPALDAGTYPGRLVQIVSLGLQAQRPYNGQAKEPKVSMHTAYELSHEFLDGEDGQPDVTKPRWVGEDFPFYNMDSDRATSTIRYLAIDPEMACEGDWEKVLSHPCNITLSKEPKKVKKGEEQKYTNYITHVSGPTQVPGYVQPELVNSTRIFDIDNPDMEVFKLLPKWLQKKLKSNLEYNGSALQKAMGETVSAEAPKASTAPPATAAAMAPPAPPPAPPQSAS